jgi:hypothetical protein
MAVHTLGEFNIAFRLLRVTPLPVFFLIITDRNSCSVASKVVNRVEHAKHSRRRAMLNLSFAGLESSTWLLVFLHFGHFMIKSFQVPYCLKSLFDRISIGNNLSYVNENECKFFKSASA